MPESCTGDDIVKVIILEKNKKFATVLCKNGDFIKIRNKPQYEVGAEVSIPDVPDVSIRYYSRIASVAAAALIVLALSLGTYAYYLPYNYINIDINPSIEVVTNIFDRTIEVRGLNTDGKKVVALDNLNNININECVKRILNGAVKKGYLVTVKDNAVMFTVSNKSDSNTEKIQKELEKTTVSELKKIVEKDVKIIVENVSIIKFDENSKNDKSTGKMMILENLKAADENINTAKYNDASVKEILNKIEEAEKKAKIDAKNKTDEENSIIEDSNKNKTQKNNGADQITKKTTTEITEEIIEQETTETPETTDAIVTGNFDIENYNYLDEPNHNVKQRNYITEEKKYFNLMQVPQKN